MPDERGAPIGDSSSQDGMSNDPTDSAIDAQAAGRLALTMTEMGSGRPSSSAGSVLFAEGDVFGRYQVQRCVGQGGMGVVYAARDPDLERTVALKLLSHDRSEGSVTQARRRRLLREARAMARLEHPNVLTVYEVGTIDDRDFIAMAFAESGTLADWLAAEQRSWTDIARVFVNAARGLEAAHDVGLVHRDFKPANVLMSKSGRPMVTDFGLARMDEPWAAEHTSSHAAPDSSSEASSEVLDLTRTGALLGTPAYMAPEQHQGQAADARSDQYSFCVALHEGLFGARPFSGSNLAEFARAKLAHDIASPPAESQVPERLQRAIQRGLSPDPDDRYPTMGALIETLERSLDDRHESGDERRDAAQRAGRYLRLGGLALVAAIGLGVAATLVTRDRDGQSAAGDRADERAPTTSAPVPDDPALAARVRALRPALAEVEKLARPDTMDAAIEEANALVERARDTHFMPILAEALLARARVHDSAFHETAARDDLKEAALLAQESAYDLLLARIALFEAEIETHHSTGGERASLAVRNAAAAVARMGEMPSLGARLDTLHAASALREGRHQDAERLAARAYHVLRDAGEPRAAANALAILAEVRAREGRIEDSLEPAHERLRLLTEAYGPRHISLAHALAPLWRAYFLLDRPDEAQRLFQEFSWYFQDPAARAFFARSRGMDPRQTRPLTGRVLDEESGTPVAGARVVAGEFIPSGGAHLLTPVTVISLEGRLPYIVETDPSGRFEIPDLATRVRAVAAESGDLRSLAQRLEPGSAPAHVELRLQPTTSVRGTVEVDEPGHILQLSQMDADGTLLQSIRVPVVDGAFSIQRVVPDTYTVSVHRDMGDYKTMVHMRDLFVPAQGLDGLALGRLFDQDAVDVRVIAREDRNRVIPAAVVVIVPPGVRSGWFMDTRRALMRLSSGTIWQSEAIVAARGQRQVEVTFADVTVGDHVVCVLPLPGDLGSPDEQRAVIPHQAGLWIECRDVTIHPAPDTQEFIFQLGTERSGDRGP